MEASGLDCVYIFTFAGTALAELVSVRINIPTIASERLAMRLEFSMPLKKNKIYNLNKRKEI